MQLQSHSMMSRHAENVLRAMERAQGHQNAVDGKSSESNPFAQMLVGGVGQVNKMELDSQANIEKLLAGEDINQAEVFTGIQKADMSFRLLVQIRNKLMQAYEEINAIRV